MTTETRLPAGDWGINDWYHQHSINEMIAHPDPQRNEPTTYTRHTIREPPKCPPRQAHCSCGAVLIVEDDDETVRHLKLIGCVR